jgi:hypothetical protein
MESQQQKQQQHDEEHESTGGYYIGLIILAVCQLFFGIANLALGIANAVVCGFMGPIGYGIWGSVLCFIGGGTGLAAGISRSRSKVTVHMVLCIIVAIAACVQLAMGTGSATADHQITKKVHGGWSIYFYQGNVEHYKSSSAFYYFYNWGCGQKQREKYATTGNGPTVTDALLASFAIFQGLTAVLAASFSCRANFCPPGVDHMPWEEYGSETHLVKS